jgi:hypothetical protein
LRNRDRADGPYRPGVDQDPGTAEVRQALRDAVRNKGALAGAKK